MGSKQLKKQWNTDKIDNFNTSTYLHYHKKGCTSYDHNTIIFLVNNNMLLGYFNYL